MVYHRQSFVSVDELKRTIVEAWQKQPQSFIDKNVGEWHRRLEWLRSATERRSHWIHAQLTCKMLILCTCLFVGVFCSVIMRPSSLGGGRILRRTLSVRLSVRLSVCLSVCLSSVPLSLPSVTSRHLANYNDTHVLFGTRWGPHIVRPSRPHKFLFDVIKEQTIVIRHLLRLMSFARWRHFIFQSWFK